jgi:hypothetical protein
MKTNYVSMLLLSCATAAAASARRLIFKDGLLYEPERPTTPLLLRGADFVFTPERPGMGHVTAEDRKFTTLMPKANAVRLVVDHFHDAGADGVGKDCHCEDSSTGYVTHECLAMFDEVLNWTSTEAKVWAIFTGRGSHSKTDMPGIWANATLRKQYTNMWRFIAKRYAYHDNILGYEVMSEPCNGDNVAVHALHQEMCGAVWSQDAAAACVVSLFDECVSFLCL